MLKSELNLKQRLIAVLVYILVLFAISGLVTGMWIPTSGGKSLWLFSTIGFYFFSHLTSPYFVTPRDSLANAATSALLLSTMDLSSISSLEAELNLFRWISVALAVIVALSALTAIALYGSDRSKQPLRLTLSRVTFRLSNRIGRGQIMFSPPVLISIIGFYQGELIQQLVLLLIWTIFIFIEPIELFIHILNDLRELSKHETKVKFVGEILRIDDPNIIRVKLDSVDTWKHDKIHIVHLPDSRQVEALPLFVQLQGASLVGTGLFNKEPQKKIDKSESGHVYYIDSSKSAKDFLKEISGNDIEADLIGFIVENSEISRIWFEVSSDSHIEEGGLVFVQQGGQAVYYQILNAKTKEESFTENPRGTQVVIAEQLGTLDKKRGS